MKSILKLSVVLFLGVFVMSSCGGGSGEAGSANGSGEGSANEQPSTPQDTVEVTVKALGNTMVEMSYDLSEIKVSAGSLVKLTLENTATDETMIHNIVFITAGKATEIGKEGMNYKDYGYVNLGNPDVIAASTMAQPGETVTFEFEAPAAGTYEFICTTPGHWGKMKGSFIVN